MKKQQKVYLCNSCGASYSKWQGKCNDCNSWNTIIEEVLSGSAKSRSAANDIDMVSLINHDYNLDEERVKTKISEFDRVLGGGIIQGSAILIGGEPGIGKSTLILQILNNLASDTHKCLYISGEESIGQINNRAKRLNINNKEIKFAGDCVVENIIKTLERNQVNLLVIDSLQTLTSHEISSAAGTVSQLKHSAFKLIELAKRRNISVIFIGHITKEGQIAGPKILEHMVDAVFYFEPEKSSNIRVIRAHKNRFGAANEIGLFEMGQSGLIPLKNASSVFIDDTTDNISGVTLFCGLEGTRPVLYEVQALVLPTFMASPRRAVVGWDINRLSMLIALISSRLNIKLQDKEVYLNIAGGAKVDDPAIDLAVLAALLSAALNKPIPRSHVFAGEVSLSGVVREPKMQNIRAKEVQALGFQSLVSNRKSDNKNKSTCKLKFFDLNHIYDVIKFLNNLQ